MLEFENTPKLNKLLEKTKDKLKKRQKNCGINLKGLKFVEIFKLKI